LLLVNIGVFLFKNATTNTEIIQLVDRHFGWWFHTRLPTYLLCNVWTDVNSW